MNTVLRNKVISADIEKVMKSKGYKFFTNGVNNINLIGIRSKDSDRQDNTFDDVLLLMYKTTKGVWIKDCYYVTTDPGLKSLKVPVNSKGCAILVPGQYSGMFKIGKHKGQYAALVQNKPCKVYRDNNRDNILDYNSPVEEGMFGINLHKAGAFSSIVDNWSAGCTVLQKSTDFDKVMDRINTASKLYGTVFTYTLLEENDL